MQGRKTFFGWMTGQTTIITYLLLVTLMLATYALAFGLEIGDTAFNVCPRQDLKPMSRILGQRLRISVKVSNVGDRDISDAILKLGLPSTEAAFSMSKMSVFPSRKGMQVVVLASSIYWLHVNIPIKRSKKFIFKAKTTACAGTVLAFEVLMYQATPGERTPYCPVSTPPIQVTVKPRSSIFRKKHPCTTPAPTPTPIGPFYPYAENQRCLEGELTQQPLQSEKACWKYCSLYGDTPAPFYFDWSTMAQQCYCSGVTCTLIYDPDFTVYIANDKATVAPSRSPTVAPTPTPEIINYAENCGCLEDLPLNTTTRRQLFHDYQKSESKHVTAIRLQKMDEEENRSHKALLFQGHDENKKSDTYYNGAISRVPRQSEEITYSNGIPRYLTINPNATRIYNVTLNECSIYCANQSPPPTFFTYTDNFLGFTSCACPGAKCTIIFGVPDTNVYLILPVEPPTNSPTRAPTSVGDTGAPSPAPTASCCPVVFPTPSPTVTYPFFRALPVTTLNNDVVPPDDTWAINPESFDSVQYIAVAPDEPTCALRQENFNNLADNSSKATAGVYYDPQGLFNGMLFKDFVLTGFDLTYNYYVESTGQPTIAAPDIRIKTMSPSTGRQSDFLWSPFNNQGSQGAVAYQAWAINTIDETTGSNSPWPVGNVGGEGWSCTLGCYMPVNSTENLAYPPEVAANTFRSLETYVNGLLDQSQCSSPTCAMRDAIITGIQVVLGPKEPSTVAFSQNVTVASSGSYSWRWRFSC